MSRISCVASMAVCFAAASLTAEDRLGRRNWHGHHHHHHHYGPVVEYYGFSGGGYYYGPAYPAYGFAQPLVSGSYIVVPPDPFLGGGPRQPTHLNHPLFQDWLDEDRVQWETPLDQLPIEELPRRFIKPSSTDAKLRSIRAEHQGDLKLQAADFAGAARHFRDAIAAAPDRPDPYFRLGVADIGKQDFIDAARQFKLGLQLDRTWPQHGPSLQELIGDRNLLAKAMVLQFAVDWAQEDIRDPDRLFVLGVMMYADGDTERALEVLEVAARLGGKKEYLAAYLDQPVRPAQADGEEAEVPLVPPPPPAPDAAVPGLGPVLPERIEAAPGAPPGL